MAGLLLQTPDDGSSADREDTAFLQQFQWQNLVKKYGAERMKEFEKSALYTFPTHSEEWDQNLVKMEELNLVHPIARVDAVCKGIHSRQSSADKSGGLIRTLYLCKNARISLTCNLNLRYHLFNRAVGTVVDIVYPAGKRPADKVFPEFVIIDLPGYTGPPFIPEHPTWIPVLPIERRQECASHCCSREQLPLRLAFGQTIHSVQGMTIGAGSINRRIVISPGGTDFESKNPGILYVALTRAKTAGDAENLPDFAFHPSVLLNDDRVRHKPNTKMVRMRDAEVQRLHALALKTKEEFAHLDNENSFLEILAQIPAATEE